jgi:hypothetical protein
VCAEPQIPTNGGCSLQHVRHAARSATMQRHLLLDDDGADRLACRSWCHRPVRFR